MIVGKKGILQMIPIVRISHSAEKLKSKCIFMGRNQTRLRGAVISFEPKSSWKILYTVNPFFAIMSV